MANINIFALGGQDENGKNCYVLEVNNDIYIINYGIKVPITNKYGVDCLISDYQYLYTRQNRIKGLFITHAHDEVFAGLPWLLMEFPNLKIYGSHFTNEVIKDRISKYKIENDTYEIIDLKNPIKLGNVTIKPFSLANSILGSYGYNFQTEDGDIVFMSNFVIDDLDIFGKTEIENISKNPLMLLMDARKSNYSGHSANFKSITGIVEKTFKKYKDKQKIIVGAYDEEMYVLKEILELAIKYDRPVAFYGRVFQFLCDLLVKLYPNFKLPKIVNYKNVNQHDDVVVLITSTWSRLYQRFVRIAENEDVYLKLKSSDQIVMIAPPINGIEVEYTQMLDKVLPISPSLIEVNFTDYYSFRPAADDIKQVIKILKPKYFIPISALYRYLAVSKKLAMEVEMNQNNIFVIQNGRIVWLKDGQLVSSKNKLKQYGEIIIDGFGVGDVSFGVIKERELLAANGFLTILIQLDKKTKTPLENGIKMKFVGVAPSEKVETIEPLILKNILSKFTKNDEKWNSKEIQNTLKRRIQKLIFKLIDKTPMIIINFFEL